MEFIPKINFVNLKYNVISFHMLSSKLRTTLIKIDIHL